MNRLGPVREEYSEDGCGPDSRRAAGPACSAGGGGSASAIRDSRMVNEAIQKQSALRLRESLLKLQLEALRVHEASSHPPQIKS